MSDFNLYEINTLGITDFDKCKCSNAECRLKRQYVEVNVGEMSDHVLSRVLNCNNTVDFDDESVAERVEALNGEITYYEGKLDKLFKEEFCTECGIEQFSVYGNYYDCSCVCGIGDTGVTTLGIKRTDGFSTESCVPNMNRCHVDVGTMLRFCSPVTTALQTWTPSVLNSGVGTFSLYPCTTTTTDKSWYTKNSGVLTECECYSPSQWYSPSLTADDFRCGKLSLHSMLCNCCIRLGECLTICGNANIHNFPNEISVCVLRGEETISSSIYRFNSICSYNCFPVYAGCQVSASANATNRVVASILSTRSNSTGVTCVGYVEFPGDADGSRSVALNNIVLTNIHDVTVCEGEYTFPTSSDTYEKCSPFTCSCFCLVMKYYTGVEECVETNTKTFVSYDDTSTSTFRSTIGGSISIPCIYPCVSGSTTECYKEFFCNFAATIYSPNANACVETSSISVTVIDYPYFFCDADCICVCSCNSSKYIAHLEWLAHTTLGNIESWVCGIANELTSTTCECGRLDDFEDCVREFIRCDDESSTEWRSQCSVYGFLRQEVISWLNLVEYNNESGLFEQCLNLCEYTPNCVLYSQREDTFGCTKCACLCGKLNADINVVIELSGDGTICYCVECSDAKFIIPVGESSPFAPKLYIDARNLSCVWGEVTFNPCYSASDSGAYWSPSSYHVASVSYLCSCDSTEKTLSVCKCYCSDVYFYPHTSTELTMFNYPAGSSFSSNKSVILPTEMGCIDEGGDSSPPFMFVWPCAGWCTWKCGHYLDLECGCILNKTIEFNMSVSMQSPISYSKETFPYRSYAVVVEPSGTNTVDGVKWANVQVCNTVLGKAKDYIEGDIVSFSTTEQSTTGYVYDVIMRGTIDLDDDYLNKVCLKQAAVVPLLGIVGTDDQSVNTIFFDSFCMNSSIVVNNYSHTNVELTGVCLSSDVSGNPVVKISKDDDLFISGYNYCISGTQFKPDDKVIFKFNTVEERCIAINGHTFTVSSTYYSCSAINLFCESSENGGATIKDVSSLMVSNKNSGEGEFSYTIGISRASSSFSTMYNLNPSSLNSCLGLNRYVYGVNNIIQLPSLNVNIGEHITVVRRTHETDQWEIVYRSEAIKSTLVGQGLVVVKLPDIYTHGSTVRITRDDYMSGSSIWVVTSGGSASAPLIDMHYNSLYSPTSRLLTTSNGIDTGTDEIMLTSYIYNQGEDSEESGWTTVLGQNRWQYCNCTSINVNDPNIIEYVDMNNI